MAITVVAATKSLAYPSNPASIPLAGSFLSSVTTGDLIIGDDSNLDAEFVGIAESTYVNATTPISVSVEACPNLSVVAKNASDVNAAVLPGTPLYYSAQSRVDTGPGTYIGRALEKITAGSTATIGVAMSPRTAPAIADDTTYSLLTFGPFTMANVALNDLIVDGFTPGVAGSIVKVWYVPIIPSTTNCDVDLQFTIGGTVTTGGLITITDEAATEGDAIAGTAITAANAFTAAQEINLKCVEATTACTEGTGNVIALVAFTHDHE